MGDWNSTLYQFFCAAYNVGNVLLEDIPSIQNNNFNNFKNFGVQNNFKS
jgi:hypothetical protein